MMDIKRELHSLIDIFREADSAYPEKTAIIVGEKRRTYREIYQRARRTAGFLRRRGLGAGDPIAIISVNSVDYVETVLGCVMAGAVVVQVNWRLAAPELHHLLMFNGVKLIFFRSGDSKIRREMSELTGCVCPAVNMDRLDEILAGEQPIESWDERGDEEVLFHLHTSGTTGTPKTVRYKNGEYLRELSVCVASLGFDGNTVFQLMSQLFHSACIGTYSCLACGGTVVLFPKFNPREYLQSIEDNHVTRLSAIPTVLTSILKVLETEQYDISSVKVISYSTCPMPPELIGRAMEKFRCGFQQSYGMTEMGSIVTMLTPEDHLKNNMKHLASVGKPIAGHQVKIVGEDSTDCPAGHIGEVVVRGPGMMLDYYQMPEETRAAIVNGWYHTRDMGYLDEEGFLFIKGRKNDMIISGGENIFPREVEVVLLENPDVVEAAVFGMPDAYWGEAVHACVELREGATSGEQQIRDFCRGKIAGYKIPKKVNIVSNMPRTATGKVQKAELLKEIEREGTHAHFTSHHTVLP